MANVGRNTGRLSGDVEQIKSLSALKPLGIVVVVTKDIQRIIDATINHFGQMDVLMNNAGIMELDDIRWIRCGGVWFCVRHKYRSLIKKVITKQEIILFFFRVWSSIPCYCSVVFEWEYVFGLVSHDKVKISGQSDNSSPHAESDIAMTISSLLNSGQKSKKLSAGEFINNIYYISLQKKTLKHAQNNQSQPLQSIPNQFLSTRNKNCARSKTIFTLFDYNNARNMRWKLFRW